MRLKVRARHGTEVRKMSALSIDSHAKADQLDDIGRRMEHMIHEQDGLVSVHSKPHWELVYDDRRQAVAAVLHLHGETKAVATVTASTDGSSAARCATCGESLQISGEAA
jgi:hypothetical protein